MIDSAFGVAGIQTSATHPAGFAGSLTSPTSGQRDWISAMVGLPSSITLSCTFPHPFSCPFPRASGQSLEVFSELLQFTLQGRIRRCFSGKTSLFRSLLLRLSIPFGHGGGGPVR